MGNCRLSNKKKGGRDVCKQKITERCVNISKIKNNYLFPPLPCNCSFSNNDAKVESHSEECGKIDKNVIARLGTSCGNLPCCFLRIRAFPMPPIMAVLLALPTKFATKKKLPKPLRLDNLSSLCDCEFSFRWREYFDSHHHSILG